MMFFNLSKAGCQYLEAALQHKTDMVVHEAAKAIGALPESLWEDHGNDDGACDDNLSKAGCQYLEAALQHKTDMVVHEAAKAIGALPESEPQDLNQDVGAKKTNVPEQIDTVSKYLAVFIMVCAIVTWLIAYFVTGLDPIHSISTASTCAVVIGGAALCVRKDARQCCTITAHLLHLQMTGEILNSTESTYVCLCVTRLFMFDYASLRRMVYLLIKETAESCNPNDVIIVTQSLKKYMTCGVDLYHANALGVLSKIADSGMLGAIERYVKQVIVDSSNQVSSAALVSSCQLFRSSLDCATIVKRWVSETQEACLSSNEMVQFHALQLLSAWYGVFYALFAGQPVNVVTYRYITTRMRRGRGCRSLGDGVYVDQKKKEKRKKKTKNKKEKKKENKKQKRKEKRKQKTKKNKK
jgi:hypothetical protein